MLMIGLACKNAILIVEFARQLQAEGHVRHGGGGGSHPPPLPAHRHDLICLYPGRGAAAGAGGAGAASQQAIGTVVFGGMLSSTLLAIPFVPVFYVMTQRFSERRQKPAPPAAPPVEKGEGS